MMRKAALALALLAALFAAVSCSSKYPDVIYMDMSDTGVALVYNSTQRVLYCAELPMDMILAMEGTMPVREKMRAFCGETEDIYCACLARDGRAAIPMLELLSKTGDASNIDSLLGADFSALASRMRKDDATVVFVDGANALEGIDDPEMAGSYFTYWFSQMHGGRK